MSRDTKNPVFVESGRRGARKRWADHTPAAVRIDSLEPHVRAVVLALIRADESAKKAPDATTSSASEEVKRHARADTTP